MSRFIQALESRTLLSAATPQGTTAAGDEANLVADARSVRAAVRQFAPLLQADARAIARDLTGVSNTPANRKLVASLRSDQQKWVATLGSDASKLVQAGQVNARKAVMDGIRALLNPTNAAALSRLANDLSALQAAGSAPLSKLLSDAAAGRTVLVSDVNAITAANTGNSALQTDAGKAQTDSENALNAANSLSQTIQNDIGSLVKDLGI